LPVKYEYDPKLSILHARPHGELSIADIANYFHEVSNDNKIGQEIIEVVHFDDVVDFRFSSDNATSIPQQYKEVQERKKIRATIFIAKDEIQFGIARMFQILFEINDIKEGIFVVRTDKKAENLIKEIRV